MNPDDKRPEARSDFYAFVSAVWGDSVSREHVLEAAEMMEKQGWTHHRLPEDHQVIPLRDVMATFRPLGSFHFEEEQRHPLQPTSAQVTESLHKHLDAKLGEQTGSKRRAIHQALFAPKKDAKLERAKATAPLFAQGKVWFPPIESEVRKSENGLPMRHSIVGARKSGDGLGLDLLLEDALTRASTKASWSCFSPDRHGDVLAPNAFDRWIEKFDKSDKTSAPGDGARVSMDFGHEEDHTVYTLYRDGEIIEHVGTDTASWLEEYFKKKYEPRAYPPKFLKLWGLAPDQEPERPDV